MPRTYKCSFCNRDFYLGTGIMYVRTDGNIYWFCSSKCRKNMLFLKRYKKKPKWVRSQKVK